MGDALEGQSVAREGATELADFFLLIVGKDQPRAGHVFEELEDDGAIFRKKDVRLPALIAEVEFLLEIGSGIGVVGKSQILGRVKTCCGKSPGGFITEVVGEGEDEEEERCFNKSSHRLRHRGLKVGNVEQTILGVL